MMSNSEASTFDNDSGTSLPELKLKTIILKPIKFVKKTKRSTRKNQLIAKDNVTTSQA